MTTHITSDYLLIYLHSDNYWDKSLNFYPLKYSRDIYSFWKRKNCFHTIISIIGNEIFRPHNTFMRVLITVLTKAELHVTFI